MESLPLQSRHARLGGRFGAVAGREVVLHYGPEGSPGAPEETAVARELRAMHEGAALVDLSVRDVVRVTGPDRVSYLQGMLTNDVTGMPVGGVRYAALLTAKGAMVADARVVRREDDLLLLLEPGLGPTVLAHLERYLISEDAAVADASAEFGQLALVGPKAWELARTVFGLPGAEPPTAELVLGGLEKRGVLVLPSALLVPGVDLLVHRADLETVFDALLDEGDEVGLRPAGWEALEARRVEQGVPRYGADMDERTIPLEANLERALHYQKGCYIGQEVIARATFRGHVNRKLVGLLLSSAAAPRAELFQGDRRVGWLTSVVQLPGLRKPIALGYVHRSSTEPGTELKLSGDGRAVVTSLPFPAA